MRPPACVLENRSCVVSCASSPYVWRRDSGKITGSHGRGCNLDARAFSDEVRKKSAKKGEFSTLWGKFPAYSILWQVSQSWLIFWPSFDA
jgi:hypothetical protein